MTLKYHENVKDMSRLYEISEGYVKIYINTLTGPKNNITYYFQQKILSKIQYITLKVATVLDISTVQPSPSYKSL